MLLKLVKKGNIKIKTSFNSNRITSFGKEDIPTQLPLQIEIIDFGLAFQAIYYLVFLIHLFLLKIEERSWIIYSC